MKVEMDEREAIRSISTMLRTSVQMLIAFAHSHPDHEDMSLIADAIDHAALADDIWYNLFPPLEDRL